MKANPENFQFIILGNTGSHILQIGGITTKSVSSVTLLGVKERIDNFIEKHTINYIP